MIMALFLITVIPFKTIESAFKLYHGQCGFSTENIIISSFDCLFQNYASGIPCSDEACLLK